MDTKRLLTGTVVGGIAMLVLGYLIWGLLLAGFFDAQAGTATGVDREAPLWWARAVGSLSLAALVTLSMGWAGATTVGAGFRIGATVGFLAWLGVDFLFYANTNILSLTGTIVDPVIEIFRTGAVGATIAAVTGRGGASQPAAA